MRRSPKLLGAVATGAALAMLGSGAATADTVYNTLDNGVDASVEVTSVAKDGSTSINLRLTEENPTAESDGDKGACAVNSNSGWTYVGGASTPQLKLTAHSSDTSVLEVTNPDAFTACSNIGSAAVAGSQRSVTVTGKSAGTAEITFTVDSTNSKYRTESVFALATAKFQVTVTAPTDPCAGVVAPAAPVVTFDPAQPDGSNSWYRSSVPTVSASSTTAGATIAYSTDGGATYSTTPPALGQGATIVTARATSATCNMSSTGSNLARVDTAAPSVTPGNVDNTTWRNTDLTETFTASDNVSGLGGDQGLNAEGQFQLTASANSTKDATGTIVPTIVTKVVRDVAGNETSRSVRALIDKMPPTVSANVVDTAAWRNTPFTGSFTASDGLSGLADQDDAEFDVVVSAESTKVGGVVVPTTVPRDVFDVAGNKTTRSASANIDLTDPMVSADVNDTTWRNSSFTAKFTASDALSGLANGDDAQFGLTVTAEATKVDGQVVPAESATRTVADNARNTVTRRATALIDKTNPTIHDAGVVEVPNAAGWHKTAVTAQFDRADALSGLPAGVTSRIGVPTGAAEGSAVTVSSGPVADVAGNEAAAINSSPIKVDLTDPTNVQFTGGPAAGSSTHFGSVPSAPTGCTADDAISGVASCSVTGYSTAIGTHTMTATATDHAGRTASAQRSYTVLAWDLKGYYQPVDMSGIWNTVKNGATVPLKFEVFAGSELTSTSAVKSFTVKGVACPTTGLITDDIELVTTGGTSLRYDATAGQFVQNWQTPKLPGACYAVIVTTQDDSTISANFLLK